MTTAEKDGFIMGLMTPPAVGAYLTIALAPALLLRAYVLVVLWRWYVVPTLGLPALSMFAAFGIALIAVHLQGYRPYRKDPDWAWWKAFTPPLGSLFTLLIGWIGTWFA